MLRCHAVVKVHNTWPVFLISGRNTPKTVLIDLVLDETRVLELNMAVVCFIRGYAKISGDPGTSSLSGTMLQQARPNVACAV